MKNKYIITFAGPKGCSKTPIANYLSIYLNLPILNNDAIRSEVTGDLLVFNENEYQKRRDLRLEYLIKSKRSFIYDVSMDRVWEKKVQEAKKTRYDFFVISIDISSELLKKIYKAKNNHKDLDEIEKFINDHQKFLEKHSDIVNVHITDENFKNRLEICRIELEKWLGQ